MSSGYFIKKEIVLDYDNEIPVWHCALDAGISPKTGKSTHLPGVYICPEGNLCIEPDGEVPVEWVEKLIRAYKNDI